MTHMMLCSAVGKFILTPLFFNGHAGLGFWISPRYKAVKTQKAEAMIRPGEGYSILFNY
ncbi:hypothetical protein [Microcoleus sp.]|uniref:hypothetical protein n=1 Tax=Microcoleus sp. TaxID=44472 RepID=UPI0035269AC6